MSILFETFEEWRKAEGAKIAPWLELLGFGKWKPARKSVVVATESEVAAPVASPPPEPIKQESENDLPSKSSPKVEAPYTRRL